MTATQSSQSGTRWSGLETPGMRDAKCSLLLQEDVDYDAKIKALPKQRVMVYQDKGFNPATASSGNKNGGSSNGSSSTMEDNYQVDFKGATIVQLEPILSGQPQKTMPITMTIGGLCSFTPENYQDFRVMMRTKEQSQEMDIAPNGNFDWPDVSSLLLCPVCGKRHEIPKAGSTSNNVDYTEPEYWMVFYPLLQITVMKGSQMTLGTRTICRLTCLECMENLLEGLTLVVRPGSGSNASTNSRNPNVTPTSMVPSQLMSDARTQQQQRPKSTKLSFTLPATDVLEEAGSASFLEDGPPRPETHPHVDDILDAWTLYNLWEHSGAWEALQNDYRLLLSKSMRAEASASSNATNGAAGSSSSNSRSAATMDMKRNPPRTMSSSMSVDEPRLKERMGKPCGNHPRCQKVHGRPDEETNEIVRLSYKCQNCHAAYYCSRACRTEAASYHQEECVKFQKERESRREKRTKKVPCDTCKKKFPYTRMKKCSRCRKATYCSVDCQRIDWERHKVECTKEKRHL